MCVCEGSGGKYILYRTFHKVKLHQNFNLTIYFTFILNYTFVCIEVLRPTLVNQFGPCLVDQFT